MRKKPQAKRNIGIEAHPLTIDKWKQTEQVDFELIHGEALEYLKAYTFSGKELLYCDPPYRRELRRSQKKIYRYDYSVKQHIDFLDFVKSLPCMVMISGYYSDLYTNALSDW